MIRKIAKGRIAFTMIAALVLSISTFADTIRLKDGSLIKGTIVGFADGRFVVVVGDGARRRELSLSADEIASIEFEPRETTGNSSSTKNSQPASESRIVPVSTKPAPKVVVTEKTTRTAEPRTPAEDDDVTAAKQAQSNVPKDVPSSPQVKAPTSAATTVAPITIGIRVLADNTANGWTNSGWVVKKGQRIRITGSGSASLGKGVTSTPSGIAELDDSEKLLKAVPTGALIAVIGDDNNDFIYVGTSREFTAGRDGALFLGINEGDLSDNSGAYDVKIEIIPTTEN